MTEPVVDPTEPEGTVDAPSSAAVGSPPAALPEEQGGEAALVGYRESEAVDLPAEATPITPPVADGAEVVVEPVTEPAAPEVPELSVEPSETSEGT